MLPSFSSDGSPQLLLELSLSFLLGLSYLFLPKLSHCCSEDCYEPKAPYIACPSHPLGLPATSNLPHYWFTIIKIKTFIPVSIDSCNISEAPLSFHMIPQLPRTSQNMTIATKMMDRH